MENRSSTAHDTQAAGCHLGLAPERVDRAIEAQHRRGAVFLEEVAIGIDGDLNRGVTELPRDVLDVLALGDEKARISVPERVDPDRLT